MPFWVESDSSESERARLVVWAPEVKNEGLGRLPPCHPMILGIIRPQTIDQGPQAQPSYTYGETEAKRGPGTCLMSQRVSG